MSQVAYGGLSINANTTAAIAPNTAAKYTQGWAAHGVSQHGDGSVSASAANSRLTLKAGVYEILVNLVVETELVSGTSGDAVGDVTFQLYKGGSAVSGALAKVNHQASDRPATVTIVDHVEVSAAQVTAGTNYVEVYAKSGDASGNDITVSNGRFLAKRLV